jgi:hypothetical protein
MHGASLLNRHKGWALLGNWLRDVCAVVMDAAPDMAEVDLGALRAHRRLRKLHLAVLFAIIEVCVGGGGSVSVCVTASCPVFLPTTQCATRE